MDISSISTEALRHELRLRQRQTAGTPGRCLSGLLRSPGLSEENDENNDEGSLFVRERLQSLTSSALKKSSRKPAGFKGHFGHSSTGRKYGQFGLESFRLPHKSANYDRSEFVEVSDSRKRRRSKSCETIESEDELSPFHPAAGAITYQKSALSRTANVKERQKAAYHEEEDRRLAECLAAEEEEDLLMLTEGQWTIARPGTKGRPIHLDNSTSRYKHQRSRPGSLSTSKCDESSSKPFTRHRGEAFGAAIARQIQKEEAREQEVRLHEAVLRTRDCAVCGDETLVIDIPSLSSCTHEADVCADCYTTWLGSQLEGNGWQEVRCPGQSCKVNLTYEEIKAYASKDAFERYDVIQARNVLSADPNFRWCRAEGCTSGQIHDVEEVGNEFVCVGCHDLFCTVHDGPYHDGETCDEYDYRTSGQKERDERKKEDEASEEAVGKLTKTCPGERCGRPIEKNGGCTHMTCSQCKHEFCWVCLADWRPRECNHGLY